MRGVSLGGIQLVRSLDHSLAQQLAIDFDPARGSHPKTSVDVHRRPSQRAHIALLLRPPQVGVPSELDSVCREAQLDMIVFPTTERARTLTATILQIRAFSTDWAELCSLPSGGSGPITCSPCG